MLPCLQIFASTERLVGLQCHFLNYSTGFFHLIVYEVNIRPMDSLFKANRIKVPLFFNNKILPKPKLPIRTHSMFTRILQIKFWFWPCIRPTFPLWKFQQIHLNISALTFSLSGRRNISKNVKQIPWENMGGFLASNQAESWRFGFMGWLSLGQMMKLR